MSFGFAHGTSRLSKGAFLLVLSSCCCAFLIFPASRRAGEDSKIYTIILVTTSMPERSVSLKPGAEAGPEDAFGVCSGRLGDGNCCVEAKESYIQYRLVGRQHATRDLNMVPHTKR